MLGGKSPGDGVKYSIYLVRTRHKSCVQKAQCNLTLIFGFSVYPGGSMLEMSNGYPNSVSPVLGGSPSPGPSPLPQSLQMKIDEAAKMSTTSSTRPNLRVVISNQQDEV